MNLKLSDFHFGGDGTQAGQLIPCVEYTADMADLWIEGLKAESPIFVRNATGIQMWKLNRGGGTGQVAITDHGGWYWVHVDAVVSGITITVGADGIRLTNADGGFVVLKVVPGADENEVKLPSSNGTTLLGTLETGLIAGPYDDDAAAAAANVPVGYPYYETTTGIVQVRQA